MEIRRVFVDKLELKNGMVLLAGPAYKYVAGVLRKGVKDCIDIVDGKGCLYHCVIDDVKTREVRLHVLDTVREPKDKRPATTLCVSPIKGPRMDWLVEKATELGASRIVPVLFKRTVVRPGDKEQDKIERWKRIAVEASRQSGRLFVPEVAAPVPLQAILPIAEKAKNRILLYEKEKEQTLWDYFSTPREGETCIVIGPEGGIEEAEIVWLIESGFTSCTLGENILRSETAPLAVLSIVLYEQGRRPVAQ